MSTFHTYFYMSIFNYRLSQKKDNSLFQLRHSALRPVENTVENVYNFS